MELHMSSKKENSSLMICHSLHHMPSQYLHIFDKTTFIHQQQWTGKVSLNDISNTKQYIHFLYSKATKKDNTDIW